MEITYADYLAIETTTDRKHEWLRGEVYAMAGGTPLHGALTSAMAGELRAAALSCGCIVYSSDVKIRVPASGLATYPDVSVVCGAMQTDADDPNALTNPSVLLEVLSDATEAWDRGEKFEHYAKLDSLRDYVLVSQHAQRIEHFARGERGQWVLTIAGPGESLTLTALDATIAVDRVYAGLALLPRPPRQSVVDPPQR